MQPVTGGDICMASRAHLPDGTSVLVKTRPGAPEDFFAAEARGLRWLGAADAVPVPAVLGVDAETLVLEWVDEAAPTAPAALSLGRGLAALHRTGADRFGSPTAGYVGTLPTPSGEFDRWPEFFAVTQLEPTLRLARDRGALDAAQAQPVEQVLSRLEDLAGAPEPPARLHGDLWSGNVLWGSGDRPWLIDPAAHGGHRETDLAMLALFGAPGLETVRTAYEEVWPLADGWRARVPLHQLHPLLVHAALFGGGYGARAAQAAREALRAG
ncbi:MAG TPA: fructosamine kinase family protein [Segeticoccus sp.]|nr:fructosamine kinase family protein [Segeticoccus sp.]HET8601259.1 fructosamine kinase family protein [Segeticoccus sp.]